MIVVQRLAFLCCSFFFFHHSSVQGLRVAEKKCEDYMDQNSQVSFGGNLALSSDVLTVRTFNCSTSVDLIANGEEALVGEFPHQALLGRWNNDSNAVEFVCGGSLISERFVLTAAHCGRPIVVRLGEHNLTDANDEAVDYMVSSYTKHPNYKLSKSYFDIALVELSEEVSFIPEIRPACIWTSDTIDSKVVATGFGATGTGNPNSDVLMKVQLEVIEREKCKQKFEDLRKYEEGIMDEQLCVGSHEGGKDTCTGDSGGPLQVVTDLNTCVYYVVGITSSGYACGTGTTEAVYTKVASYVDWIEEVVWPDESSEPPISELRILIGSRPVPIFLRK